VEVRALQQKYRRILFSVAVIVVAAAPSFGSAGPAVWLSLYNDAGVSARVLKQAEEDATRVFVKAGLTLTCTDGKDPDRTPPASSSGQMPHLFVRILPKSKGLPTDTFGVSFLGPDGAGAFADVFLDRAQTLSDGGNISLAQVLGHVIAHELGHLLLGSNAHSAIGIMRPHWQREELIQARMGRLRFTDEQALAMEKKIRSQIDDRDGLELASRGNLN
jgi:hypothetical protein